MNNTVTVWYQTKQSLLRKDVCKYMWWWQIYLLRVYYVCLLSFFVLKYHVSIVVDYLYSAGWVSAYCVKDKFFPNAGFEHWWHEGALLCYKYNAA